MPGVTLTALAVSFYLILTTNVLPAQMKNLAQRVLRNVVKVTVSETALTRTISPNLHVKNAEA